GDRGDQVLALRVRAERPALRREPVPREDVGAVAEEMTIDAACGDRRGVRGNCLLPWETTVALVVAGRPVLRWRGGCLARHGGVAPVSPGVGEAGRLDGLGPGPRGGPGAVGRVAAGAAPGGTACAPAAHAYADVRTPRPLPRFVWPRLGRVSFTRSLIAPTVP